MINRLLKDKIKQYMTPQKVIVLYGPRQAGKTTLVEELIKDIDEPIMKLTGEDREVHQWLGSSTLSTLKRYIGNYKFLVIDEAQKIDGIGLNLKLLVDHIPGIRIIATGSSSFELANQVGEPLVGRKWQFMLYPIAQCELSATESNWEAKQHLDERLIFGSYPAVLTAPNLEEKRMLLNSYVDNYLFRDILELNQIKKHQAIFDLLKLLAFQIGKEVSMNELANNLNIGMHTVERYLDILEKTFVLKRVGGFSRNLRKEISKNSRFYFYDNGIRNALINNFNPINQRNDIGELWENYLFMERLKKQEYTNTHSNLYFWRTYDQKEIDLIEERDGKLYGFEFKWKKGKVKVPKEFLETYAEGSFEVINQENYLDFIC